MKRNSYSGRDSEYNFRLNKCLNKRRYDSIEDALIAIDATPQKNLKLYHYHCTICKGRHLTKRNTKKRN